MDEKLRSAPAGKFMFVYLTPESLLDNDSIAENYTRITRTSVYKQNIFGVDNYSSKVLLFHWQPMAEHISQSQLGSTCL